MAWVDYCHVIAGVNISQVLAHYRIEQGGG